jgi:protein-tyrosine kinase
MERIKKALEKARQERQIRQGGDPAPAPDAPRTRTEGTVGPEETLTMSVDETVLRENRIISALETSAFTYAYNLLRTQVLQRFKENNWNVLGVTSPGTG